MQKRTLGKSGLEVSALGCTNWVGTVDFSG